MANAVEWREVKDWGNAGSAAALRSEHHATDGGPVANVGADISSLPLPEINIAGDSPAAPPVAAATAASPQAAAIAGAAPGNSTAANTAVAVSQ